MQPLPEPGAVLPLVRSAGIADEAAVRRMLGLAADAARTLTGGVGFGADGASVEPEIAGVLVRSVARSLLNPELSTAAAAGSFSASPGAFADWSDADFVLLERYRARRPGPGRVD